MLHVDDINYNMLNTV